MAGTPPAEFEIDENLLRRLLSEQQPDLAELPLALCDVGWDNSLFRLGDELLLRLPRRKLGAEVLAHEQRLLPQLGRDLPLPTPIPLRVGVPGGGYPWPWSVIPWLPGTTANLDPPASAETAVWARFLRALHQPAPDNAPRNPFRGVPLTERAEVVQLKLDRLRERTSAISSEVEAAWRRGLETPPTTRRVWLHGDLHARNVLTLDGRFSGVIDWGDVTACDSAVDLASIWMLFANPSDRETILTAYHADEGERRRALAWAVVFGVLLLDSGLVDHPAHARMGEVTLARVTADLR